MALPSGMADHSWICRPNTDGVWPGSRWRKITKPRHVRTRGAGRCARLLAAETIQREEFKTVLRSKMESVEWQNR